MNFSSLVLKMPEGKPYDHEDWFHSFLGAFVLPAVTAAEVDGLIELFWFGQYQHEPFKRFTRFRYATTKPSEAAKHFEEHRKKHGFLDIAVAIGEQNYSAGEFLDGRSCGDNVRKLPADERRELVIQLLHAASRLMLHTLSHADGDGYWHLETNHDKTNNPSGKVFDSVFHLLDNSTNHRPLIVEVAGGVISAPHFNILQSQGANLKQGPVHKILL
jgi:hypothetical protein